MGEWPVDATSWQRWAGNGPEGEGSDEAPEPAYFFYGVAYPRSQPNSTQLVRFEAATGQVEWLGTPMSNPGRIHGLVVTNQGRLFGINSDPDKNALYEIDRDSGQARWIGPAGWSLDAGMAYDPVSDTIFGLGKATPSASHHRLLVFDRESGAAASVGPGVTGLVSVSGLAWDAESDRLLAFDNATKWFVGFDRAGNATWVSRAETMPSSTWGLAMHDRAAALALRDGDPQTHLVHYNPDSGAYLETTTRLSEPLIVSSLEYGWIPQLPDGVGGFPGYVGVAYSPWPPHQYHYHLVAIEAATGMVHWRGSGLTTPGRLDGLAITNDHKLYAIDGEAGDLYSIDWTTGQASRIGPSGFDLAYGLAYDAATDTIYGVGKPTPGGSRNWLLAFDRQTGAATPRGPGATGLTGTSGMARDTTLHRLIVFDNADDQFWSFDAGGTATLLSVAEQRVDAWGAAYDGSHLVMPVRWNYDRLLSYYDPLTGMSAGKTIRFSEPMAFEALEFLDNAAPQIVVSGVDHAGPMQLDISFAAFDHDSDARIALFYDDDPGGFNGRLIVEGLSETDGVGSYRWDYRGIPDGDVYLYAEIDDGVHLPRRVYWPYGVSLRSPGIGGRVFLDVNRDGSWGTTERARSGVQVYLDANNDGRHQPDEPIATTQEDDPFTDEDETGWYRFWWLDPGDYVVRLLEADRHVQSYPDADAGHLVRIGDSSLALTADFGIHSRHQNPVHALDVNADGHISAIDALLVINWLNASALGDWPSVASPFLDVNGDLWISPLDALLVINRLNTRDPEGEQSDRTADREPNAVAPARTRPAAPSRPSGTSAPPDSSLATFPLEPRRSLRGTRVPPWDRSGDGPLDAALVAAPVDQPVGQWRRWRLPRLG